MANGSTVPTEPDNKKPEKNELSVPDPEFKIWQT